MALTNEMIAPAAPSPSPLANVTPTAMPGVPAPMPSPPKSKEKAAEKPVLPPEVQNNKVVKEILQGSIPGVVVRPNIYYPKAYKIAENWEDLMAVGLDFYFAPDESTILFNPAKISEQEIAKAVEQGQLTNLLPDWETITGERPVKPPKGVQVGFGTQQAGGAPPAPPAAPGALPPTNLSPVPTMPGNSNLQNKLNTQRVRNVNVVNAGPTAGPVPGAGRVVNATAVPAV